MTTKIRRILVGIIIIASIATIAAVTKLAYNQNIIMNELERSGMVDPGQFRD